MGLTLAEVEGLAVEGWLDWQVRRGELWVRPVVLSRLRVRDQRVPVEPKPLEPEPEAATSSDDRGARGLDDFGRAA